MMKFYIFILQKNRDTLYVQAMEEYLKRLGKYCTIEVKYVKKRNNWEESLRRKESIFWSQVLITVWRALHLQKKSAVGC